MEVQLGYSKRAFTDQVQRRVINILAGIERKEADVVIDQVIAAYEAAGPELARLRQQVVDLLGSEPYGLDGLVKPRIRATQDGNGNTIRYFDGERPGGRIGEILASVGCPEWENMSRHSFYGDANKLEDEILLLTGAFAHTKAKFWDTLYPPTAQFLEDLKGDHTLESLKATIIVYAEALR